MALRKEQKTGKGFSGGFVLLLLAVLVLILNLFNLAKEEAERETKLEKPAEQIRTKKSTFDPAENKTEPKQAVAEENRNYNEAEGDNPVVTQDYLSPGQYNEVLDDDGELYPPLTTHHEPNPALESLEFKRTSGFTAIPLSGVDLENLAIFSALTWVNQHSSSDQAIERKNFAITSNEKVVGKNLLPHSYINVAQTKDGIPIEGAGMSIMVKHTPKGPVVVHVDSRLTNERLDRVNTRHRNFTAEKAIEIARVATGGSQTPLWRNTEKIRKIAGRNRLVREIQFEGNALLVMVDLHSGESWTQNRAYHFSPNSPRRPPEYAPPPIGLPAPPSPPRSPTPRQDAELVFQGRGLVLDPGISPDLKPIRLPEIKVTATEPTQAVQKTDRDGRVKLKTAGTNSKVSFKAKLDGSFARIHSRAGILGVDAEAKGGQTVGVLFNPEGEVEDPTAQVTGYVHVNVINRWLNARGLKHTRFNRPVVVQVNLTSMTCNAGYQAGRLYLFKSGKRCGKTTCMSCVNSAMPSVIYHEYGHLVDESYGGITNSGLSEGWGDVLATLIADRPELGFGLNATSGKALRTADNNYQYPTTGSTGSHNLGQAWAGFVWHLRAELISSFGKKKGVALTEELVLPSLISGARDIPAAVAEVLARDDNDGNLANGTPRQRQITAAAKRHSLQRFLKQKKAPLRRNQILVAAPPSITL